MNAFDLLWWFGFDLSRRPDPRAWTVGITDNPGRRKQEHGRPPRWMAMHADSEATARSVERHLLGLGMKGGMGGPTGGRYVYIF